MFNASQFKLIRIIVILVALAAILFKFTSGISAMNKIKDEGADLLLKLRPADPRALMLGDYMALAYDRQIYPDNDAAALPAGTIILKRDSRNVGRFERFDDGEPLTAGEIRIAYARRFAGDVDYGGARYFFEEGQAKIFEDAEYGIFKVSADGKALLTGLAGEDYARLGQKR